MDASNLAKMTADEEILRFPTAAFAANQRKGGLYNIKEKVKPHMLPNLHKLPMFHG